MSPAARIVAALVGIVLLVLAAATLAAELVAAVGHTYAWPYADLWARLTVEPTVVETGLAALGAALIGIALLVLAVRSIGGPPEAPTMVTLETPRGITAIEVAAIERALRYRLATVVPDLKVRALSLGERGEGCSVRVEADVAALDLIGVQWRAAAAVAGDLERLAGIELVSLDLIVAQLVLPAAQPPQQ